MPETERRRFHWRSTSRAAVTLFVVLGALAAGGGAFALLASLKPPPVAREPVAKVYNVDVFHTEAATLRERLSAFGTAQPEDEVVVAAQVAGRIVEVAPGHDGQLRVGESYSTAERTDPGTGSPVGEVLVRLDDRDYQQRLAQARAKLVEANAELARLAKEHKANLALLEHDRQELADFREEYARFEKLRATNSVTPSQLVRATLELRQYEEAVKRLEKEVDLYDTRRDVQEARLETARNEVEIARLDLERTTVRVPFDGRISEVMVDLGHFLRPGDPIVRLTGADRVEVPVPITLEQFARIEPRLKPGVPREERPPVELAEKVTERTRWCGRAVRAAPVADRLTRTVEVYVEVDNRRQATPLLPGAFVHASLEGPLLDDVLLVPRDAILADGRIYVARPATEEELESLGEREAATAPPWKVEERRVRVARTLETLAIVESGVAPGERVVLTNLDVVHDGAWIAASNVRSLDEELAAQRIGVVRRPGDGTVCDGDGSDAVPVPIGGISE